VAIVLDHPVQHLSPAFRRLEDSPVVETTVLYWRTIEDVLFDARFGRTVAWDLDLLEGYEWWAPSRHSSRAAMAVATMAALERGDPRAVLCFGWATPNACLAIVWCLLRGRSLLLIGDSTWQHDHEDLRGRLRGVLLRALFRRADGALSTGTFNREFYIRHGMRPGSISPGVLPIDVGLYRASRRRRPSDAEQPLVVGFAGKLISRKGAHVLLSSLALLPREGWRAVIIGDGPERPALESFADELGIAPHVCFAGFLNQSEMPAALARCDVLVVPSTRDLRVLVAVEAMLTGVPVVVRSNTAVSGPGDVIDDGRTGFV
jgi:glycosyltransferase involved in cell wall biosynthesis